MRTKKYRCITLDPPWNERGGGKIKRGADAHYPLLKTPDIVRVILQATVWHPSDNCHLWLWVTDNFLEDGLFVMRGPWVSLRAYDDVDQSQEWQNTDWSRTVPSRFT